MGNSVRLRPAPEITLGEACDAYLATLDHAESKGTHRIYAGVLAALTGRFGRDVDMSAIAPQAAAAWFRETWADSAGSTWNVRRAALHSAAAYWTRQGWLTADPFAMIERRRVREDRDRALSHAEVERLLTDEKIPLRERLLWRLLYESAARSAEVLRLNVEDLDMANRRTRVRRKGGAMDVIVWQTGTARLLPRYLKGRTSGPLFVTDRRAPGSSSLRVTWTSAAGRGCLTSGPRSCSRLRPEARRCTSSATRR